MNVPIPLGLAIIYGVGALTTAMKTEDCSKSPWRGIQWNMVIFWPFFLIKSLVPSFKPQVNLIGVQKTVKDKKNSLLKSTVTKKPDGSLSFHSKSTSGIEPVPYFLSTPSVVKNPYFDVAEFGEIEEKFAPNLDFKPLYLPGTGSEIMANIKAGKPSSFGYDIELNIMKNINESSFNNKLTNPVIENTNLSLPVPPPPPPTATTDLSVEDVMNTIKELELRQEIERLSKEVDELEHKEKCDRVQFGQSDQKKRLR